MTAGAAVIAISLALLGGFYFGQWRRAERTSRVAKAAADTAGSAAWRARGGVLLLAAAAYAAIYLWLHGRGR
jgi:hypothetical protein